MSEQEHGTERVEGQVRLDHEDLYLWTPPCVERWLPGVGPTWVHGYTAADAATWMRSAYSIARSPEPRPEVLAVAQVWYVCRTEPNGGEHTFRVSLQDANRAFEQMMQRLPGRWVEQACLESDALALQGYFGPPAADREGGEADSRRLGELLADREFWTALSALSLKLYGVPLARNGEPLGEVLNHLRREQERVSQLRALLAPLARAGAAVAS